MYHHKSCGCKQNVSCYDYVILWSSLFNDMTISLVCKTVWKDIQKGFKVLIKLFYSGVKGV
jgi:hypothetical protein